MKKILIPLFCLLLCLSCKKEEAEPPYLEISTDKITLSDQKLSEAITIESNYDWVIPSSALPSWVNLSATSGTAGIVTLTISAVANSDYYPRTAEIIVQGKEISRKIILSQKQKNAFILSSNSFHVSLKAQDIDILLQKNMEYDVSTSASWLSIVPTKRGLEEDKVTVRIEQNFNFEERKGEVIFKGRDVPYTESVFINQDRCRLIADKEITIGLEGGEITLPFEFETDYEIISRWEWMEILEDDLNQGITLRIPPYADNMREGSIVLSYMDGAYTDDILIRQHPPTDVLFLRTKHFFIEQSGVPYFEVELLRDVENYDVIIDASWIRRVTTRALTKDIVAFQVDENPDHPSRSTEIIFREKAGFLADTLLIQQDGSGQIRVGDRDNKISWEGGDIMMSMWTKLSYNVTIVNDWITEISGKEGRAEHDPFLKIFWGQYRVESNPSVKSRIGRVVFTTPDHIISDTLIIRQSGAPIFSSKILNVEGKGEQKEVLLSSGLDQIEVVRIEQEGDWCQVKHVSPTSFVVEAKTNPGGPRQAVIHVRSSDLTGELTVRQGEDGFYQDEDYILLQKATVGNGINIVIMGDGFTREDLQKNTGKYESSMREAADHFFSVYPYSAYRDHFNVYMLVAESEESGVAYFDGPLVNNKFGSTYLFMAGIDCHFQLIEKYAMSIPDIGHRDELTVMLILNSDTYGGVCRWTQTGFAIGVCAMSTMGPYTDFRAIVMHEVGGHAFPKLYDEYFYSELATQNDIDFIKESQAIYDIYENIDFTDNLDEIHWGKFFKYPKYAQSGLGAHIGAYWFNAYRPEFISCMNNNVDYYNAPSRWAIVKRIKKLAGIPYTFEEFVAEDKIIPPTQTRSNYVEKAYPPLPPPILIE